MPVSEQGEKQQKQQFDHEIRDMISALTRRLTRLQKKPTEGVGASSVHDHDHHHEEEDHGGVAIITMAGSNEGATMRGGGSLDLTSMENQESVKDHDDQQSLSPFTTYLNSNFQGVNNSIMVGGGYSANDPGIHLDVDDHYAPRKQGKKKPYAGSSKSHHSS